MLPAAAARPGPTNLPGRETCSARVRLVKDAIACPCDRFGSWFHRESSIPPTDFLRCVQGDARLDNTTKFFGGRLVHNSSIWTFAIEHSGEHYGQLVVYYRANNLVPPDSRRQ